MAGVLVTLLMTVAADGLLWVVAGALFDPVRDSTQVALPILMLAATALCVALGAGVAARLAPRHPLLHAAVLVAFASMVAAAAPTGSTDEVLSWYGLASLFEVPIAGACGALLAVRSGRHARAPARPAGDIEGR